MAGRVHRATVKALRAEVTDWDITVQAGFTHRESDAAVARYMHSTELLAPQK